MFLLRITTEDLRDGRKECGNSTAEPKSSLLPVCEKKKSRSRDGAVNRRDRINGRCVCVGGFMDGSDT